MAARSNENHTLFLLTVGLFAWLVPGAGHLLLNEKPHFSEAVKRLREKEELISWNKPYQILKEKRPWPIQKRTS